MLQHIKYIGNKIIKQKRLDNVKLMISFFKFERLKKSLSNDQMEFFRKECELTLAEGDKKVQFEQAVTTLVANTLNPNKNSCKYSAGCTS